jgi:hypothetical protein
MKIVMQNEILVSGAGDHENITRMLGHGWLPQPQLFLHQHRFMRLESERLHSWRQGTARGHATFQQC